jgi:uncharacterized protein (TIGR03435 family)
MFGGESERTATQRTRGDAARAAFVLIPQNAAGAASPHRTNEFAPTLTSHPHRRGHILETMRPIRAIAIMVLAALALSAQEFEVASIKASSPQSQVSPGIHIDGSLIAYTGISLTLLIGTAYDLKNYQIAAPEWMASTRWDISAKLPENSNTKQIPAMLQALLRDRFQMKTHPETISLPVYALVKGKGELRIRQSKADSTPEANGAGRSVSATLAPGVTTVRYNNGAYFSFGNNKFEGRKLPMSTIAEVLARFADHPVIDATNLTGVYDFTMEFSPEDFRAMMVRTAIASGAVVPPETSKQAETASGDTLFAAVEKLGLKLERRNAPMERLVIDQALKMPIEN